MKNILTGLFFLFITGPAFSQTVEFFKWNYTKQDVINHHQKSVLLEEISKNQLDELHYVQFDSGYAHHFIYLFKKDELEGVKTHWVNLAGQNNKMYALEEYEKMHDKYVNKYGLEKVKLRAGSEQAVKISELHLPETDIFVTIEKNGSEYYLAENFFKKGSRSNKQ